MLNTNVTEEPVGPIPRVEAVDVAGARGFDALFDQYFDRAVRLAFLTGAGNDSDAQDIAADALARVWLRWRARDRKSFGPILRRTQRFLPVADPGLFTIVAAGPTLWISEFNGPILVVHPS